MRHLPEFSYCSCQVKILGLHTLKKDRSQRLKYEVEITLTPAVISLQLFHLVGLELIKG